MQRMGHMRKQIAYLGKDRFFSRFRRDIDVGAVVKSEVIQGTFATLKALYFTLSYRKPLKGFWQGNDMSTVLNGILEALWE